MNVPYEGEVEVEGSSRTEAAVKLMNVIRLEEDPLSHPLLKGLSLDPVIEDAEWVTVVSTPGEYNLPESAPSTKAKKKAKRKFREPETKNNDE